MSFFGRDVTLITVHKLLRFAITKLPSTMFRRQIRQLNYISQFCQKFTRIAEIHNLVADTLSGFEVNARQVSDFGINSKHFAVDQRTDAATLQLKNNPGGLQIKKRQLENSTNAMLGDVLK